MKNKLFLAIVTLFLATIALLFLTSGNNRNVATVTNIHGIPFPKQEESYVITEKLAHADIYLNGSSLAKKLVLTIIFTPYNTDLLEVGIRENSFWLSYPKLSLYEAERNPEPNVVQGKPITQSITIPLTDKIIDSNGSVDLMFFTSKDWATEYEGVDDKTYWELNNIDAHVDFAWPTKAELKNYLKSKLTREKPV